MSIGDFEIEQYELGAGKRLGRFYRIRDGKKQYLEDYEIWLCEDLLPQADEPWANGIYRED